MDNHVCAHSPIVVWGPIKTLNPYAAECQAAVYVHLPEGWVRVEQRVVRFGPGADWVPFSAVLDPEWTPDFDAGDDRWGYSLYNGYRTVYTDRAEFVSECLVSDAELKDGYPCPSWAHSCPLGWQTDHPCFWGQAAN